VVADLATTSGHEYQARESQADPSVWWDAQDLGAEQAVLGCAMLDPRAAHQVMSRCTSKLFYREAHKRIFWALEDVRKAGLPIDLVTVCAELRKGGNDLDEVGGPDYLTSLLGQVVCAAHVNAYIAVLVACRKRYLELSRALAVVHDPTLIPGMDEELRHIRDGEASGHSSKTLLEFGVEALDGAIDDHLRKTGDFDHERPHLDLDCLDYHLGGFPAPGFVVVMGDSSHGKTQTALQAFYHSAYEHPMHALYCSLEMSTSQVVRRLSYLQAGKRSLSREEMTLAVAALTASETMHFYHRPGMGIGDINAESRRLAGEVPLSLVIVDYLQLVPREDADEREHLERCSADLKNLAMATGASVLALSQVSWDKDKTEARTFGARGIGFGADVELEVRRPGKTIVEQRAAPEATLSIRKDRDGEVGQWLVDFDGTRFREKPTPQYRQDARHGGGQ